MLDDIVKKRTDYQKPRKEGLTYVVDKYQGSNTELWELASPYVDGVKMQGAIPLLSTETILAKRIKFYQQLALTQLMLQIHLIQLTKLSLLPKIK